jgi:ABC-type transporter Mla subunit MlaD|tara:strand:+ start:65 stop:499 length:435 start_codon:yes stop_codon:yes gene_type:complete
MLAEIAAANAAFAVIRTAVRNGKEIADVASSVGKYVNATEDLRRKGEKKKRAGGADLTEFMQLEKLRQQEEELKQIMIYAGRPGLWHDWQKFQAQARKDRLAAAEAQRRKIQRWIEIGTIAILCIAGLFGVAALVVWALYLKGL